MTKRHAHITLDVNANGQFEITTFHSVDGMVTRREKEHTTSAGGFDHEPQVAARMEAAIREFTTGRLKDWGYTYSVAVSREARDYLTFATVDRIKAAA